MKYITWIFLIISLSNLFGQPVQPSLSEMVVMRDGNKIALDVYLPGSGSYPVILVQTPYNKNLYRLAGLPLGIKQNIQTSEYAIVVADWRCFYGSTAACVPQYERGKDGFDLIEWISSQNWSNGKVGTWGPSALGRIQYQTAREQHPAHICAVPLVAGPQYSYEEYYPGGCLRTEYVEQLDGLGFGVSGTIIANPAYNLTWQVVENLNTYYDQIKIPMLLIGGWYDHNLEIQIEAFQALKTTSDPMVRDQHRLLMGPWVHGGFNGNGPGASGAGALTYPLAKGWSDSLALRFFDFHLRGIQNDWDQSPTVQYYRMGSEKWESADAYPTGQQSERVYYFDEENKLSLAPADETTFSFTYDPSDPSPTIGGTTLRSDLLQGPYDQAPQVESRSDHLSFSSELLVQPVQLNGNAKAIIWFSSDRSDTDICLRLTDVYPDGRSMLLADDVRRLRFRNSFSNPQLMSPGQAYEVEIQLPALSHTFLPGHRIRLNVSSSNYPRFDSNLNNGGAMYTAGDTLVAVQTVYCSTERPSRLILPLDNQPATQSDPVKNNIRVSPNPFTDQILLEATESGKIQIFNPEGKLIFEKELPAGKHTLQLAGAQQGIYILRQFESNGSCRYSKLVKL